MTEVENGTLYEMSAKRCAEIVNAVRDFLREETSVEVRELAEIFLGDELNETATAAGFTTLELKAQRQIVKDAQTMYRRVKEIDLALKRKYAELIQKVVTLEESNKILEDEVRMLRTETETWEDDCK